jgi:hypothetical protein
MAKYPTYIYDYTQWSCRLLLRHDFFDTTCNVLGVYPIIVEKTTHGDEARLTRFALIASSDRLER